MAELSEIRVAEGDKFRETRGELSNRFSFKWCANRCGKISRQNGRTGANARSDGSHLITAEYIERFGDVDNALACYYDRSVERATAASEGRIGEGELRRWFGTALITPTGTRGTCFSRCAWSYLENTGLALKELEEAHVIRREDRSGTTTHELTHDRFIEPIQKSNDKWLARYQRRSGLEQSWRKPSPTARMICWTK
jgi:hypothetical protein